MNRILFCFLLLCVFPFMLFGKNADVVFIGISQGSSPAYEETLDRLIRENLASQKEITIADYAQTQSLRRKIGFDESPSVSRQLIESLKQYGMDSTMFIWGSIKKCSFTGMRRKLIRQWIRGELVLTLNIYSLRYKNYAFSGDIPEIYEKSQGFFLFGNAEKEILLSTPEKKELIDRLLDQAARKSASTISSNVHDERIRAEKESGIADAKFNDGPSVSDMFHVPSVEAASVDRNRKKATPAADTVSKQKQTPSKTTGKANAPVPAAKSAPAIDTVKTKK